MADLSRQLQDATAQYQDIQKDLADVIAARQKLDSQLQENQNVQKVQKIHKFLHHRGEIIIEIYHLIEFHTLADDANIYKLIGPVLLKQDKAEAVLNVSRRLEHIQSEIKRVEGQLKTLEEKSDKKKVEIIQLQTQMQAAAQQGITA